MILGVDSQHLKKFLFGFKYRISFMKLILSVCPVARFYVSDFRIFLALGRFFISPIKFQSFTYFAQHFSPKHISTILNRIIEQSQLYCKLRKFGFHKGIKLTRKIRYFDIFRRSLLRQNGTLYRSKNDLKNQNFKKKNYKR